jgi:hypothetical protein
VRYIINDHVVLQRAPEGPLAPYIASFSNWASEQGYALCSLRRRIRIAVGFSRWLAEKSIRLRSVSTRHSARYLRCRARRQRIWMHAQQSRQMLTGDGVDNAVPLAQPDQAMHRSHLLREDNRANTHGGARHQDGRLHSHLAARR